VLFFFSFSFLTLFLSLFSSGRQGFYNKKPILMQRRGVTLIKIILLLIILLFMLLPAASAVEIGFGYVPVI
jgi:hypothetical protein